MDKFRLKPAVRKYFDEDLHTKIHDLETWESQGIPKEILERVDRAFVEYGIEHGKYRGLKGWSNDDQQAHYPFTVILQNINLATFNEIDEAHLMDKIQSAIKDYFV